MSMADKRKLQEPLVKLVKENKKKGLTFNCKKIQCIVVSKRNYSREVRSRDVKIKCRNITGKSSERQWKRWHRNQKTD